MPEERMISTFYARSIAMFTGKRFGMPTTYSLLLFAVPVMGIALFLPGTASADSITGSATVGFGQVGVNLSGTDFFSWDAGDKECDTNPGTGLGCFDVVSGTGTFAGLTTPPVPTSSNSIASIGPTVDLPYPVTDEVEFDNGATLAGPGVSFDLTSILTGSAPPCVGAGDFYCTIYIGGKPTPYTLIQEGPDVAIEAVMFFNGYEHSSASGTSTYQGIFTTQLTDTIDGPSGILATIGGGGTLSNSWDATFSPIAESPEPDTLLLVGLGLFGFGYASKRKWNAQRKS
jgi:hypothetical protein